MNSDEKDLVARAINHASARASNLINEYASRFENRSEYEPLENLAQIVSNEVVKSFCKVLVDSKKKFHVFSR
jgi:hypothetical protein